MKHRTAIPIGGRTKLIFALLAIGTSSVLCDSTFNFDGSPQSLLRSGARSRFLSTSRSTSRTTSTSSEDFERCSDETNTVVSNLALSLASSNVPRLKKEHFETYCPSVGHLNENRNELECDFQPLSMRDDWYSESLCESVGGKLIQVPLELCNYTVPSTNDFTTFVVVDKIYMANLPLCTGMNCDQEQMSDYLSQVYEPLNLECPAAPSIVPTQLPSLPPSAEGLYNRFALRHDVNNTLITRSCNWLRRKPEVEKAVICERRNYQLYTEDYLPASRVCFETCEPYCVEEALNAKFAFETILDSGQIVEDTRQCKWLTEKKTSDEIERICSSTTEFDSQYGQAAEVCTETCPDSSNACLASSELE